MPRNCPQRTLSLFCSLVFLRLSFLLSKLYKQALLLGFFSFSPKYRCDIWDNWKDFLGNIKGSPSFLLFSLCVGWLVLPHSVEMEISQKLRQRACLESLLLQPMGAGSHFCSIKWQFHDFFVLPQPAGPSLSHLCYLSG